ncbi:MAG: methionyl-tRNA formyltransferase [Burkholderiaceae bacterium]|nr:MAG: methionyl-tRNA formyltransferase [Burkholderiaceae bacterium]
MNIGFAGSDNFSLKILSGLTEIIADGSSSMSLVLTIPAKNQGRGKILTETPISSFSKKNSFFIETIVSGRHIVDSLKDRISDLDYLIVASFGYILGESILSLPKHGCINVHPSILPRWRGAAPIQRAIEAGDKVTGVSIIKMGSNLDAGPIWSIVKQEIDKNDTYADLEAKLAKISLQMLKKFLKTPHDKITYNPQNEKKATYAKKIISNELKIDWTQPAVEIVRKINALYPKPCTYTYLNDRRLKLGKAEVLEHQKFFKKAPGTLLVSKDRKGALLAVHCGSGMLKINLIQKESGNWIDAKSFINGFKNSSEIVFGRKI